MCSHQLTKPTITSGPKPYVIPSAKFVDADLCFQAAKTTDAAAREQIRACKDPLEAKRLGAKLDFDKEEWKTKSLVVMEVFSMCNQVILQSNVDLRTCPFLRGAGSSSIGTALLDL